jgi:hypothetical protein
LITNETFGMKTLERRISISIGIQDTNGNSNVVRVHGNSVLRSITVKRSVSKKEAEEGRKVPDLFTIARGIGVAIDLLKSGM